ncbi:phosphocholine cytidylyltransferase family protein [Chitiniphilus purpureus]|uniref:Phosphocholine cytidylyltransferase family protein n=1 Tax=Chitiniphilus purpureus TaxID=2981137 RepID=A0ABY6DN59_9NEIS|nr:phosphocholine cytidylyltransferase family protein [Chitiniphilus sp. CD1]UXY15805.1 phosphocholine cytidylyltransferase family protein [Chitiniphilus sp. CD1]
MTQATSAIVLAAGLGTRLAPLTDEVPKCLTEFYGRPLLGYTFDALLAQKVEHIVMVVGHQAGQIHKYIESNFPTANVTFVSNAEYARSGTVVSMMHGLTVVPANHDVLIVEADVVFESAVLERLLASPATATALSRYRPDLTGTFATLDAGFFLTDWAHERSRSDDFQIRQAWKTVNLTRFDSAAIHKHLLPAANQMLIEHNRTVPFEFAVQHCIKSQGLRVKGIDVSDLCWYEIDTLADLNFAKRLFAPVMGSAFSTQVG